MSQVGSNGWESFQLLMDGRSNWLVNTKPDSCWCISEDFSIDDDDDDDDGGGGGGGGRGGLPTANKSKESFESFEIMFLSTSSCSKVGAMRPKLRYFDHFQTLRESNRV